jgi:hypothetical protein
MAVIWTGEPGRGKLKARPPIGLAIRPSLQALCDMAATASINDLDSRFYKPADEFFNAYSHLGLTSDEVTLSTQLS